MMMKPIATAIAETAASGNPSAASGSWITLETAGSPNQPIASRSERDAQLTGRKIGIYIFGNLFCSFRTACAFFKENIDLRFPDAHERKFSNNEERIHQ